jgi:ribosomal-protein-alanine N-acetyltransferase
MGQVLTFVSSQPSAKAIDYGRDGIERDESKMLEKMKEGRNDRWSDRINTLRTTLRPMTARDIDPVRAMLVQPGIRRYLCDDRVLARQEVVEIHHTSAMLYAQAGTGLWCMTERNPGERLVGIVGFVRYHEPPVSELIFALDDAYRGQGYAAEAGRAILRYAKCELGWTMMQASTDPENEASVRTLRRLGFTEVYTLPGRPASLRIYRRVL